MNKHLEKIDGKVGSGRWRFLCYSTTDRPR